jgi:hypothetical protein
MTEDIFKLNLNYINQNLNEYPEINYIISSKLNNWFKQENKKNNLFKSDHDFSLLELLNYNINKKEYKKLKKEYDKYILNNKNKLTPLKIIGLKWELECVSQHFVWRTKTLIELNKFIKL